MTGILSEIDQTLLRRAFALAEQGVAGGGRPFGALVADAAGRIVVEATSIPSTAIRDWTAHSEMTALREASARLSWEELAGCTLFASGEPCPMCAAAVSWCNVGRLVFGMSTTAMSAFRAGHSRATGFDLSAREVLVRGPRPVVVVGPALEDEARTLHERFWRDASGSV